MSHLRTPPDEAADPIEPPFDWWAVWRREDYSWEGLASRPWPGRRWDETAGKAVPEEGAPTSLPQATLQHQWWSHRGALVVDPADGRAYTVAHLPLAWSDGSPTLKADPSHASDIEDEVRRALEDQLRSGAGGEVDLSGVVFGTDWGPTTLTVPSEAPLALRIKRGFCGGDLVIAGPEGASPRLRALHIEGCKLDRDLRMEGLILQGDLRLMNGRQNEIGGDLDAVGMTVGGRVRARFGVLRRARFEGAVFHGEADFETCAFFSTAEFTGARFKGAARFQGAQLGDAQFEAATFERVADFSKAAFRRTAYFGNAEFAGAAVFVSAAFQGGGRFGGAAFGGNLHLRDAIFEDLADFSGRAALATDRNPQVLSLTRATGDAADQWTGGFSSADLLAAFARRSFQAVDATGAAFIRDADFSNRDLLQPSSFAGARFLGDVRFHGGKLHQRLNFHDTGFESLEYEALSPAADRVGGRWPDVSPAAVEAIRRVEGRAPLKALESDPATLAAALERVRAEVRERRREAVASVMTPDGARQSDARLEALEAAFRTLKLAMEDTRARLAESRLFKLELRARRRRRDREVPAWERFASSAYAVTADYGDSIARPVLFFIGVGLGFSLLYWIFAALQAGQAPTWDHLGDALRYSLGRMTPFGAMEDEGKWAWLDAWQDHGSLFSWAGLIRVVATLQSASALVLTFLFALAVRRKFQIV